MEECPKVIHRTVSSSFRLTELFRYFVVHCVDVQRITRHSKIMNGLHLKHVSWWFKLPVSFRVGQVCVCVIRKKVRRIQYMINI